MPAWPQNPPKDGPGTAGSGVRAFGVSRPARKKMGRRETPARKVKRESMKTLSDKAEGVKANPLSAAFCKPGSEGHLSPPVKRDPVIAEHIWRQQDKQSPRATCRECGTRFILADLRQVHPVFTSTWCPDCRSRETVRQAATVPAIAAELLDQFL